MTVVTLTSDHWRLQIDTDRGLRWLSGEVYLNDQWVDALPDCTKQQSVLKDCNFLLLPYSNRIRDGRFEWGGTHHQLDKAEKHAIHGTGRDQTWTIEHVSENHLTATFQSADSDKVNWPWPISARCDIQLQENRIVCSLECINLGSTDMPIGGGWHPYFVQRLGTADPILTVPVTGVYPDSNGDCLPVAAATDVPDNLDFSTPRALPPEQRIDHCFAGLSGPLVIHWPDINATITMTGSENVTHAILFNPDQDFFALEPVTHANDAVNLRDIAPDAGIEPLQPDALWQHEFVMTFMSN